MATLQEQLKAARAEAEAAEARVSDPQFVQEEEDRKELAKLNERKRAAQQRERDADLARRIDAAHDRLGQDRQIEGVMISALPHSFVVQAAGPKAYRAYEQGIREAAIGAVKSGTREKVKTDDVNRVYVVAGIVDWNGENPDDSEVGAKLHAFLRENGAIVTELQQRISRLDGAESEARKR